MTVSWREDWSQIESVCRPLSLPANTREITNCLTQYSLVGFLLCFPHCFRYWLNLALSISLLVVNCVSKELKGRTIKILNTRDVCFHELSKINSVFLVGYWGLHWYSDNSGLFWLRIPKKGLTLFELVTNARSGATSPDSSTNQNVLRYWTRWRK